MTPSQPKSDKEMRWSTRGCAHRQGCIFPTYEQFARADAHNFDRKRSCLESRGDKHARGV